jgi:glycosyltransferase involved in cell wall biosynthesis
MRLLVLTQKVDKNDPILGFFHRWLEEFGKRFESIIVICLEKGEYELPENVRVLSLGKESMPSRIRYIVYFYKYIWQERNNYDAVFVHMNEVYVLLGWKFWKLLHKKIFLWRNHAKGSWLTLLAVLVSNKVFCTSPHSFTARFKKTAIMPVGIDTDFFKPDPRVPREPGSILFLGRIAPVKKVSEFVDWFSKLDEKYQATIAGESLLKDRKYEESLKLKVKSLRLESRIKFIGAVTQAEALKLYQSHETYVNMTPAGSMDKTIVEAAACGMKLEVRNPDLKSFRVEDHSLKLLMDKLMLEMK